MGVHLSRAPALSSGEEISIDRGGVGALAESFFEMGVHLSRTGPYVSVGVVSSFGRACCCPPFIHVPLLLRLPVLALSVARYCFCVSRCKCMGGGVR